MIDVGKKVGSYEVVARLRSGGMATLFLGRREGPAGFLRHVAIKVVHEHLAADPTFVRMFVDEALLSARIQHPNVVHVEELGELEGSYFLVMEYVHGCTLSRLIKRLSKLGRRLSPDMAAWIAIQVAEGLHAAHELTGDHKEPLHVVHRDVSPQNVLLSETGHVKLIDFGVAKARGRAMRTTSGSLKGKLAYMSPEQARGDELDRRTDVYALGVVLWESLTGRRLFKAPDQAALLELVQSPKISPPRLFAADVSAALDAAVLRALERDRKKRLPTAKDFRDALIAASPAATAIHSTELAELLAATVAEDLRSTATRLPPELKEEQEATITDMGISVDVDVDFDASVKTLPDGPVRDRLKKSTIRTEIPTYEEAQPSPALEEPTADLRVAKDTLLDPAPAGAASRPPPVAPRRGRGRLVLLGLAAVVALFVTSFGVAFLLIPRESPNDSPLTVRSAAVEAQPAVSDAPPPPAAQTVGAPGPSDASTTSMGDGAAIDAGPTATPPRPRTEAPRHGYLNLRSSPWAEVYLGRRHLGTTPLIRAKLPAGRRSVKLVPEGTGSPKTVIVTIQPEETTRMYLSL